jgi:hypothetical protein
LNEHVWLLSKKIIFRSHLINSNVHLKIAMIGSRENNICRTIWGLITIKNTNVLLMDAKKGLTSNQNLICIYNVSTISNRSNNVFNAQRHLKRNPTS